MTIGEKLREARKSAGLTQTQMAEKLMVSRQAVTKWESDKGIPDVENLKAISQLLNVSIDYLLDNGQELNKSVIREAINLKQYGKGIRKTKSDRVMREKFPNAEILTLIGELKLTKSEKIIDNALGFLTHFFSGAPFFGVPQFINACKNCDKEFYLVNQGDKQFFVTVTDEFVERRELAQKLSLKKSEKFEMGDWKFMNCGPIK